MLGQAISEMAEFALDRLAFVIEGTKDVAEHSSFLKLLMIFSVIGYLAVVGAFKSALGVLV